MSTEAGGGVDAAPGDARRDRAGPALGAAAAAVVSLVGMQLGRALPKTACPSGSDGRHGVERRRHALAVVTVRFRDRHAERHAAGICDTVALRARAPAVRRVRPRRAAPLLAAMDWLPCAARDQSDSPPRCRRSSRTRCNASHTPALYQSRRRRQHVIPRQPNPSRGSISQGIPERSTNTIPRRASRSQQRGRPPFGFAGSSGSRGASAVWSPKGVASTLSERAIGIAMPGPPLGRRSPSERLSLSAVTLSSRVLR